MPSATTFILRPVAWPSPSPTASVCADSYSAAAPSVAPSHRSRRLSLNSLCDKSDVPPHHHPAPPTGHDLMALFPPAAPNDFHETYDASTSVYFWRQERAFFAQAGNEIARVRVDADPEKAPRGPGPPKPWPPTTQQCPPPPPLRQAHIHSRAASLSAPMTPVCQPHPAHHHHAPPKGPRHTTVQLASSRSRRGKPAQPQQPSPPIGRDHERNGGDKDRNRGGGGGGEDFRPGDHDETRRSMPYKLRRRAGKHTWRAVLGS